MKKNKKKVKKYTESKERESEVKAGIDNENENNERKVIVKQAEFDKNFYKCQINQCS